MYICSCNPFSDKAVKECFDAAAEKGERMTVSKLYNACTGGKRINEGCHTCGPLLASMTKEYNLKIIPVALPSDPR